MDTLSKKQEGQYTNITLSVYRNSNINIAFGLHFLELLNSCETSALGMGSR